MSSTGNPIGQPDPRDTYLNASNLDKALNGEAETWRDRFGVTRVSWAGVEKILLNSPNVNIEDPRFGGLGKGKDLDVLTAAVNFANNSGQNLVLGSGNKLKLVGGTTIIIKVSCDFNNCEIDLSEFSGKLKFTDGVEWVNYSSTHAVVTKLNSAGTLAGNVIKPWSDVSEVENSFVRFNTDQDFYSYRGAPKKRVELNAHTRYGQLDSEFTYPLLGTRVISVDVKKFPNKLTIVRNLNFNLGSNDLTGDFISISGSLMTLENVTFNQNNFKNLLTNQTWLMLDSCAYIRLRNIRFIWAPHSGATTGYTYNLSMQNCYNVQFENVKGSGDGWGATGSNLCRIIKFDNCHLSRIDFHQPFSELMQISNSKIGSWGVLVTATGDLIIENTEFLFSNNVNVNNSGFIRSRGDTGGFCDGEVRLTGCSFKRDSAAYTYLFQHLAEDQPKPAESPITYSFWRSITMDNCDTNTKLVIAPKIMPTPDIRYPVKMSFSNLSKGDFFFNVDPDMGLLNPAFGGDIPVNFPLKKSFNCQIAFDTVNLKRLSIVERGTSKFNFKLSLNNILSVTDDPFCPVELLCAGVVDITNSLIEGIDFYSGGSLDKKIYISVVGGVIKHTGFENPQVFNGKNSYANVSITNTFLYTTADYRYFFMAKLNNVMWGIGDYSDDGCAVLTWGNSDVITAPISGSFFSSFNRKNQVILVSGFDSDKTRKETPCFIPAPGCNVVVPITATKTITLSLSADGQSLTATPSVYSDKEATPRAINFY
ncbi:hypothetical protein CF8_0159 [Aeromonas phage CF8]|nr:hypothetical protein CF8_0159 [Aeromonas phage CF8]